jgi:hypothetical protein
MSSISLMDIINTEASLGDKIFRDNRTHTILCISNTCSTFNKITKDEIARHREKYFVIIGISKKIEESMKRLTYGYLGFKSKRYKSYVEKEYVDYYTNGSNIDRDTYGSMYQETIDMLGDEINITDYYDDVLQQMIKELKNYVVLTNQYILQEFFSVLYRTLLINYYSFIKCGMKYRLTKKDFKGEEHLITMLNSIFNVEIIEVE